MFTLTSLSSNLRTTVFERCVFRVPRFNQSILQFTRNTPWKATHLDNRIPRSTGGGRKPSSGSWIDNLPPPLIFWSILAANAGVFLAWYYAENNYRLLRDNKAYIWMQQNFTVSMANVTSGRVWTVLTCCFSQSDTTHLLFNGFTYFFMAQPVLAMLGNKQFLVLYLGGGFIASMTSLLWNRDMPYYASHGASGSIYAILSYFACREPFVKFMLFGIVPITAWVFVPGVLLFDVYEMVASRRMTQTDTAAHVGGIFAGIAYFLFRRAGIRL